MGGIIMKQFNLEEYCNNPSRKVVTGGGRNVRIVCTDAKTSNFHPIIALVEEPNGSEYIVTYTDSGQYISDEHMKIDLFFAPEKREGWVNLYKDVDNFTYPGDIYDSKAEAKKEIDKNADYVTTIKIEWEE